MASFLAVMILWPAIGWTILLGSIWLISSVLTFVWLFMLYRMVPCVGRAGPLGAPARVLRLGAFIELQLVHGLHGCYGDHRLRELGWSARGLLHVAPSQRDSA